MSGHLRDLFYYQTLNTTLTHVFEILSKTIAVNTFVLTADENGDGTVIKAFNRGQTLLSEGSRLVGAADVEKPDPLLTLLRSGHFTEVPIVLKTGVVFGRLLAIHSQPFEFSGYDHSVLQTAGHLIAQTIDLENLTIKDTLTSNYINGIKGF
ncbi:hypothetical protein ACQYAD_02100 [Neobacillus sp. SM06]|uniref:hypothetical protein n=1 Tax=Neobacillus sp. SM06 TaxID=3422492 RepID=UPI003D26A546